MRELSVPGAAATASLHGEGQTIVVLGHGAGGNRKNAMLVALANALAGSGRAALLYNFPYAEARARRPDPPACWRRPHVRRRRSRSRRAERGGSFTAGARWADASPRRWWRKASARTASCSSAIRSIRPASSRSGARRTCRRSRPRCSSCRERVTPSRARTCSTRCMERLGARAELHRVAEADHSFGVLKRSGRTPADVLEEVRSALLGWLERHGL